MDMSNYSNSGTVMHLTLHECTVINHGTIMHLDGNNNQIDNKGSIMHNDGGRVIIMGSGTSQQHQPIKEKIVYRDRVVYKNKPVRDNNDVRRINELEQQVMKLKTSLKASKDTAIIENLENRIESYESDMRKLQEQNALLTEELESTERTKLLSQIEDLKEKLKRSENRERTSRRQQYQRGYQKGVVDGSNKKKEVFDWGLRPTKEQAEALMKQLRIWLDCED